MYQLSYEQALEDKAAAIRKAVSESARKAGRNKQIPYEKAGTIKAVYRIIEEYKGLPNQRGGKATLNRMILDLIAEGEIPAPNTPCEKTVDSWINNFRKS